MGDMVWIEYRPGVYHLGSPEFAVEPGQVGVSRDGKKKYTHDGGVWAVGDEETYADYTDVLDVDVDAFEVEKVGPSMLGEMSRILAAKAQTRFLVPMHYGTLMTRATIEFGWEPFLIASALDPSRFGEVLDKFGQASLAVAQGWSETSGTELITIHDDIASTRGLILRPEWYREYVLPWYGRIFSAVHARGRKVLYVSDGNYLPLLDDILETNPDGLYIESTSMDPGEFMRRAGKDRFFLLKSDSRNLDFGSPDDIRAELRMLRALHDEFPGMMMYMGGGHPKPGNVEAFGRYYHELLLYE